MTNRIKSKEVKLKNYSITRMRIMIELANRGSLTKVQLANIFGYDDKSQENILLRLFKDGSLKRRYFLSNNNKRIYSYSLTIDGTCELMRVFRYATGKEFGCADHR